MAASISNGDGDSGFQIAPMVDVVFVLMLFFMALAATKQQEISLPVDFPGRSGTPEVPIVIAISADGRVTMNDFVYGVPGDRGLPALREKLSALADPFSHAIKDPVVIQPENDARQERVMDVLNACNVAKVTKLTFN